MMPATVLRSRPRPSKKSTTGWRSPSTESFRAWQAGQGEAGSLATHDDIGRAPTKVWKVRKSQVRSWLHRMDHDKAGRGLGITLWSAIMDIRNIT